MLISTARRSYASAVLGVVILSVRLSVRPSVCHTRDLWQKQTIHCGYFDTTRKGNHFAFLTPTMVGERRPFRLKFALKVTNAVQKRRLWQISAYNVSTVRNSETSSIMTNRKSITSFSTYYTGWAKKTGLFLEVCYSRICWHRIAFYMSYCSVFYLEWDWYIVYHCI